MPTGRGRAGAGGAGDFRSAGGGCGAAMGVREDHEPAPPAPAFPRPRMSGNGVARVRGRDGFIALAIVASVLVLQLPFRLCAVSLLDEGAILQIAADVRQGHRLYTEAVHYAFPGVFYLTAAAFAVAGTSIETARMLAILLFALASGVVYLIARWSCGRRGALAVVTLFLVYRVWAYPHWQVLSYSTLALTLSLAATWIVGEALSSGGLVLVALGGAMSA